MIKEFISFLVLQNPIALFIYLSPIMNDLNNKDFLKVLFKASLISFVIYAAFIITGNFVFEKILMIDYDAFRIYGGIVLFSLSYLYIVRGSKGFITMKEDLDDLASEIALPFMIGAGTIYLSIVMGKNIGRVNGFLVMVLVMVINYLTIVGLKYVKDNISKKKFRIAFDKNLQIFMRINGFFIGAIGIDMIVKGIQNFFF